MRVLLTGSGGFIGKNLKNYLKNKYELLTPRSYELDLINSNAVEEFFKNYDIDFVIHCGTVGGARGIPNKDTTIDDNLAMVDNILKYKNNETKVILFGSRARGDYKLKSDIDLAFQGGKGNYFSFDVDEETSTLLQFDIIDLDKPVQDELLESINREGIILYEKV